MAPQAPAPSDRPLIDRVAFTLFQVEDPVRARAFYEDLLGLSRGLASPGVRYVGELVRGPRCRMSNILDSEGNAIILHQLVPR
jgi:hypothetical protein